MNIPIHSRNRNEYSFLLQKLKKLKFLFHGNSAEKDK